jgi:hypothetical protein
MNWIKNNWKRIAKWGGLGLACVIVAILAFIGARWISSGSEYDGKLIDLAPAEVSMAVHIDSVPMRVNELRSWLGDFANRPDVGQLEATNLFQDMLGDLTGGSIRNFNEQTIGEGIKDAETQVDEFGFRLFRDILGGELVLCTDVGDESEFIALSRVSRDVRFRWSFLDIASMFFPSGPNAPDLNYSGGVLHVTPPGPDARTYSITILDDVLVVSNSRRMLNNSVQLHLTGNRGLSRNESYVRAAEKSSEAGSSMATAAIWLDLDRMRARLPAEEDQDGIEISPVDALTSLPIDVVSIQPDIFVPVNRIMQQNLDTRPFESAWYNVDLSFEGAATFHQFLMVAPDRIAADHYKYLRDTWSVPPAEGTHLELLPHDTMFQMTYRQPVDVLFNDVFSDRERDGLVGDFFTAVQSGAVKQRVPEPIQEFGFATFPRRYAPTASFPVHGVDFPLPAFALLFRAPDAQADIARALLQEYLYAQRGGHTEGAEPPQGRVSVVPHEVQGRTIYGLHDPSQNDDFMVRLNRSIRAGLVGEWLILTNSEEVLRHALAPSRSLASVAASVWRQVPTSGSASMHLNMEQFVEYAASDELAQVMRRVRYPTTLIEGRDRAEVRREIAAEVGTDNLDHPEVTRRYNERRAAWELYAATEGDRFVANFERNLRGLQLLGTTGLITNFHEDHLHVQGMLRLR